jgi:ferredoxin
VKKVTRQLVHRAEDAVARLLAPALRFDRLDWMRWVPEVPPRRRERPRLGAWRDRRDWSAPAALSTVAGIWRDADGEREAYEERPLHDFAVIHTGSNDDAMRHGWRYLLPTAGKLVRAHRRQAAISRRAPRRTPGTLSPEQLKAAISARAEELGISAIGFAAFDEKYSFAEHRSEHTHPTVIVCVLDQPWEATQTAPSVLAERAAFRTYSGLMSLTAELAESIQALGHEARPQSVAAEMVTIHYGVEAGLGQLGLNGQLLTPEAGSRCRLGILTIDAPVPYDRPVDYGMHKICDECRACVRRCPVGAIPAKRANHRGVTKAKIKTERCFPLVAREHGCAVCMKVCPIQRYGLEAVTQHYEKTGSVLGTGTDELEGFDWPREGRRYGPGEKPPAKGLVDPPGWSYDADAIARADGQLKRREGRPKT